MDRIVWIEQVDILHNEKILIDTNIWVMIEGFNEGAPRKKVEIYSSAYDTLLKNDNAILYNDHIINEFFNICARIAYANFQHSNRDPSITFKKFRKSDDFRAAMRLVQESCLNIIESSTPTDVGSSKDIRRTVQELCEGTLDFVDLILRDYCLSEKVMILTDDSDFRGSGLTIITANRTMLRPDSTC
ncbi:PIN domain-containing protein [Methylobacterium sp. J-090]|uniref:PIN domain-containing protein n=1 Tax=Methylobacterium sp. J-090 TaxID=2836666 RepID=UPI001FB914E5|nr:PIN domain-containing protein [Methylobacterium sp. J-090]MCJ2080665.1 PIN domain-containing protein [Methylobacterium sp. J-090]